ncbi:RidA family protein [Gordonia sp. zg691]|nr:RidA family protein [Gordonia jinghuaiqii]MBD0862307.1 RidA family protein [Gordonia jinghuaiqii]
MQKQRIRAATVREPAERMWSNCLRIGDLVMISGMTARGDDGQTILGDDEYEQAKVVFTKIRDLAEAAGGRMDDVVKMTIYVTDIAQNAQVWKARQEFFSGDYPACTLVEVSALAKPEILLEIEAIAVVGASSS